MLTCAYLPLTGAIFDGAMLQQAEIKQVAGAKEVSFRGSDLTSAVIVGTELPAAHFVGATLINAQIEASTLSGARARR